MAFFKAVLTFAVSTCTRMVAGLLVVKIIALNVGAEGLGQLGQFMTVIGMMTVIAGGGIGVGLVKYIAQHRKDEEAVSSYLSCGSLISIVSSAVLAVALFLFAESISEALVGTVRHADVIRALGVAQFLLGANNYALSVISGHQDARGYAAVSVAGTVTGTGLLCFATLSGGMRGAMYGLVWMPAMVALFSVPYVFWRRWLTWKSVMPGYDRQDVLRLLRYSGMMCVTICTLPVAQIAIRHLIQRRSGWESVGYWQGVSKISDAYLQFVTVALGNYYLPKLSSAVNKDELKLEVYATLRVAVPGTLAMALALYAMRQTVVTLLFSAAFLPMRDFFFFQMIGDCLKVCSWTVVYVAIAKAMTRTCIAAEVFQASCLIVLSMLFIDIYGPLGATYAYALNYLIYFAVSLAFLHRYLRSAEL